jgi:hypothetical protein
MSTSTLNFSFKYGSCEWFQIFFCDWFMRLTHHLFDKVWMNMRHILSLKTSERENCNFSIYKHVVRNIVILIKWDAKENKKHNIISCGQWFKSIENIFDKLSRAFQFYFLKERERNWISSSMKKLSKGIMLNLFMPLALKIELYRKVSWWCQKNGYPRLKQMGEDFKHGNDSTLDPHSQTSKQRKDLKT